jgi:hypothetical protein
MKIAILGSSPIALEAALRFHLHGAALTWYKDQDAFSHFKSPEFTSGVYTSDLGLGVLKEIDAQYDLNTFNWNEWQENYAAPLINYLKMHQEIKTDEVVSVTKRFLAPGEVISGRSRFLDLFRVIFRVNPKEFIDEQKDSNPETYQRLTDEFIHSLASTIEMYQDYDLVLDLRSDLEKASISVSGRALGEGRDTDRVSYATTALAFAQTAQPTPELREMCLVGSDSLAAEILLSLESWMKEPRSRLFVITTEEEPFNAFLKAANQQSASRLNDFLGHIDQEFEMEVQSFTTKLRAWQELDDFVQVKIPRPSEPIPRLNFFSGHNVSAMDELIDRKRMFLTLERPEFRSGKKHPENNHLDLKTIGVDHILVGHAKKKSSLIELDPEEAGFFYFTPARPNIKNGWSVDLTNLEGIENEIFKLFSPVDTH